MAIAYKGGNRITGLSTDTRPDVIKLVDGTIFTETNTGKEYIKYYGDWTERNQPNDSVGLALNYADETNQHMVEWFSGKQLNSKRWTQTNVAGTGTFAIDDTIDGGLKITTGATNANKSQITFNNIRQYSPTGSVCIGVASRGANAQYKMGLFNLLDDTTDQRAFVENGATQTYYRLGTADSSSQTMTETNLAVDTSWRVSRIELTASNCTLSIDGVLKATNDSNDNLPTSKLQPTFQSRTLTSSAVNCNIRYMETYNT